MGQSQAQKWRLPLFQSKSTQCDNEYPTCAEDMLELGSAQLRLGDNKSAVVTLVDASNRFKKMQDPNNRGASESVRQGYRIHEAESILLASIAKTRIGDKDSAKTDINAAIVLLESVQTHPKTDDKLRLIAAQTLEFAKQLQSDLK
jgi:hypothetical protein